MGSGATLDFYWWVSSSTSCFVTVCNGICEKNLNLDFTKNIDFNLFTQTNLLFLVYFRTFEGNLFMKGNPFIAIIIVHDFVIHVTYVLGRGKHNLIHHVMLEVKFWVQVPENTSIIRTITRLSITTDNLYNRRSLSTQLNAFCKVCKWNTAGRFILIHTSTNNTKY